MRFWAQRTSRRFDRYFHLTTTTTSFNFEGALYKLIH